MKGTNCCSITKRIILKIICLSIALFYEYTNSYLNAQDIQDSIIKAFEIREKIPYEKLYLHLDKPYYSAGEKIWFKGYLLNGITHQDNSESNFIIVELINASDSIMERKKIKRDSLGFHNAFALPATLSEGNYYIRAYSNWMLNEKPEYHFFHNLYIGNAIDNTILSKIEYPKIGDKYHARIQFYNNNHQPFAKTCIRYHYIENNKIIRKEKVETNEDGWINLSLNDVTSTAKRYIDVEFDDPTYSYKKRFILPTFNQDFHVTFFPEGGSLLSLPHQNIAFKAQGSDGFSEEIEGILYTSTGDILSTFRSEHDGMGMFSLTAIKADTYYAEIKNKKGIVKKFSLPPVETVGIALSMSYHRRNILFEIKKTANTSWPKALYLLAHTREKLTICQPISFERSTGKINDSIFNEGITHFLLVDDQGNIRSERLIFIPDHKPTQWDIRTNKPLYGQKEKVILSLTAKDAEGKPLTGNYSISITDHKTVRLDSLSDNILSNILLTSDLKGHIEDPGYYFQNLDSKTQRCIDFVMLTHGWRKHTLQRITHQPSLNFPNYIEKGQTISGRIKGFFGKEIKKGPIFLLAPKANLIESTLTDDTGEFLVNTAFKDTTTFVIQARTQKGFAGVDIEVDQTSYPVPFHKIPFKSTDSSTTQLYMQNTRERYYIEGGMRVYNLKEIEVKAKKKTPSSKSIYTQGINTYTIESDRLEKYSGRSAYDVAIRLPGVTIMQGNEIHIRNNPTAPIIVVDDVVYEDGMDILNDIAIENMSSISIMRGTDAVILGPRASGGAIVITLKDPRDFPTKPARGITTYTALGYCDNMEFYHPVYDLPDSKTMQSTDLRSTIYWNPSIQPNNEGKITIEYYTSDSNSPQDIIIEGIDNNGKITRKVITINQP